MQAFPGSSSPIHPRANPKTVAFRLVADKFVAGHAAPGRNVFRRTGIERDDPDQLPGPRPQLASQHHDEFAAAHMACVIDFRYCDRFHVSPNQPARTDAGAAWTQAMLQKRGPALAYALPSTAASQPNRAWRAKNDLGLTLSITAAGTQVDFCAPQRMGIAMVFVIGGGHVEDHAGLAAGHRWGNLQLTRAGKTSTVVVGGFARMRISNDRMSVMRHLCDASQPFKGWRLTSDLRPRLAACRPGLPRRRR